MGNIDSINGSNFSVLTHENISLKSQIKNLNETNKNLENTNKNLNETNKNLEEEVKAKDEKIALLLEALKIAKAAQFGRSTEKCDEGQLSLPFDPVEEIQDAIQETDAIEISAHARKIKKNPNLNGRVKIPDNLPREDIYLDIPESEKIDKTTGKELVKIGEDITEQLAIEPAKIYVKRYIRPQYATKQNAIAKIKTAELPPHHLNRCKADISLISYLIEQKFLNYLPLYRQSQMLQRLGIKIAESTMNDWVNNSAIVLEELYNVLGDSIKNGNFINVDETPLDVLFPHGRSKENLKKNNIKQGYLWCYRSREANLVWFDFSLSRSSDTPFEQLKKFNGYVQCDGYQGFQKIAKGNKNIIPVGCWVHARRYFLKANEISNPVAQKFINYINILYRIEHKIKEFREKELYDEKELFELRKKRATRVMNKFFKLGKTTNYLPKSALGKAITYALNQEKVLRNYILDLKITPDNNAVENAIRPVTLGRKNFLFAGSPRGGQNVAIFMSLAESCKANGVNFVEYLNAILPQLCKHQSASSLQKMLPQNFKK